MYSLAIGKNPLFNFIYNREDIILKFNPGQYALPEIISSGENLIYYDYLVRSELYEQKTSMLIDILQFYPEGDTFYFYSSEHLQSLQSRFWEYSERIISEYPGSMVSRIVKSDRPIIVPEDMDWDNFRSFNQSHFLDEVDFSDTVLLKTNILTAKAIDYLGFYSINSQNKELQEQYFIQAVDTILHKAMEDGQVYDFLMQYLIEGFEMYGFDRVISHIAANYEPSNTCINEERKSELQKRMENLRKLAVGNTAPDITIKDPAGNDLSLADIEDEYTLVLFWASWCPHCMQMIPQLNELYTNNDIIDFEVLAISIDTSASAFNQALALNGLSWINYTELKGWDSKPAIDYSIYATPSMFLLDRNRKIIGRPVSISDLRYELEKLK